MDSCAYSAACSVLHGVNSGKQERTAEPLQSDSCLLCYPLQALDNDLPGNKMMLNFEAAHPQADPANPPEHDTQDCRHDEVRLGRKRWNPSDDELGNNEEPDQEEVKAVKRDRDSPDLRIRFHGDDQAQQEADRDENCEDQTHPFPLEITVIYIADEIKTEEQEKLKKQKRPQPDLETATFHLSAQRLKV
jgi:hypothetical protein